MSTFSTFIRRFSRSGVSGIAPGLSRGVGKAIITTLFFLALAWLLYSSVYVPLQENAVLPAGISSEDPTLRTKALQDLIKKRNDTAGNGSSMITGPQEQFFQAPVVASPTP